MAGMKFRSRGSLTRRFLPSKRYLAYCLPIQLTFRKVCIRERFRIDSTTPHQHLSLQTNLSMKYVESKLSYKGLKSHPVSSSTSFLNSVVICCSEEDQKQLCSGETSCFSTINRFHRSGSGFTN